MHISKHAWNAAIWMGCVVMANGKDGLVCNKANGRVEASDGDTLVFAWQASPLENPVGGDKFKGSAFLHPLRTPGGFEWTSSQPKDHFHHFGVWWPWKFIEVDGKKYNCWEIQEGQGGLVAKDVRILSGGPKTLSWQFKNETVIKNPGTDPVTAIHEAATLSLEVIDDAQVIDVLLDQKSAVGPVKIVEYRYSGFSWRGPASWNKDNSKMTTSEGKSREDANGTVARWVVVSGKSPTGDASVLLMSAAEETAGIPEKIRVWDAKMENGTPFINFNPVMEKPLMLDDKNPAVSKRKYRIIAADRVINAADAETEWKKWLGK